MIWIAMIIKTIKISNKAVFNFEPKNQYFLSIQLEFNFYGILRCIIRRQIEQIHFGKMKCARKHI